MQTYAHAIKQACYLFIYLYFWRIKRHGDVVRAVVRYLRAAGLRATDKCAQFYPACPSVTDSEAARGLRTSRLIPDIIATDCYGTTTVFDVMITCASGVSDAATKPPWAAKQAEGLKKRKNEEFKTRCREAGIIDAAKVTRSALQNAGSIAALFLTTEAVIADAPDEGAGGGMPDMDF